MFDQIFDSVNAALGLAETWLKKGVGIDIPGYKWTGVAGEHKIG